MRAYLILACILLMAAMGEHGAAQPQVRAPLDSTQQFVRIIAKPMRLTEYLEQVRLLFRMSDLNGDGVISIADLEYSERMVTAQLRANAISQFLRYDLDGDGVVTREEIVEFETMQARIRMRHGPALSEEQVQKGIANILAQHMRADTNGDGRIEFTEMLAAVRQRPDATANPFAAIWRAIIALDEDGDGKTTMAEFEKAARAVFALIDSNGDGFVSWEEIDGYRVRTGQPGRPVDSVAVHREQARREAEAKLRAACVMPQASENAKVVLLGAYEADAVSTVTIGSQDIATSTGSIEVEPGSEPLYIVVKSLRPVIWRLSGAVERVERLVLAATNTRPNGTAENETPLVGATGIPPDRVTFLGSARCMGYFTETPSSKASIAASAVRRETGKDPAVIAARYKVAGFAVPSGEVRTTGRQDRREPLVIQKSAGTLTIQGDPHVIVQVGPDDLVSELRRFNPGGVVEIDPDNVVASRPVARYEVLPQQAGLIQLVQSGALTRNRAGELLIRQKIRFPAELFGAHQAKFLLLRGVPAPDGDPGHSCVIVEETGAPLKESISCR